MPKKKILGPAVSGSANHINRLSRIKGQISGIEKMVVENRDCADVLMQIEAVRSALRSLGAQLLNSHLRNCIAAATEARTPKDRDRKVDELLQIFSRTL